jgi:hypothetical protein
VRLRFYPLPYPHHCHTILHTTLKPFHAIRHTGHKVIRRKEGVARLHRKRGSSAGIEVRSNLPSGIPTTSARPIRLANEPFFFSFFFAQLPYGPSVSCTSSPLASSVPTSHGATTLQVPHKHKHKHFFVPSTPIYFSPAYIYSLIIRSSPNPSLHTHAALRWIPACTPIHLLYHNHHSACGWIETRKKMVLFGDYAYSLISRVRQISFLTIRICN